MSIPGTTVETSTEGILVITTIDPRTLDTYIIHQHPAPAFAEGATATTLTRGTEHLWEDVALTLPAAAADLVAAGRRLEADVAERLRGLALAAHFASLDHDAEARHRETVRRTLGRVGRWEGPPVAFSPSAGPSTPAPWPASGPAAAPERDVDGQD